MKKEIESNKEKEQNTGHESLHGPKNMREWREKEHYRLHTDRALNKGWFGIGV